MVRTPRRQAGGSPSGGTGRGGCGLGAGLTGFFALMGFLGFARFLAFATRVITSFPWRWTHCASAQSRLQAVVRSLPTAAVEAGELQ